MTERGPDDETRLDEDDGANQPPGGLRSLAEGVLGRGRQAARRGIQIPGEIAEESAKQANEALTRSAEQVGLSDQLDSTRRGVRRTREVLTGDDIRQLDEFTDAVTRVAVGQHRDEAELTLRVVQLERTVEELSRERAEMAERLAKLERIAGGRPEGDAHDGKEGCDGVY